MIDSLSKAKVMLADLGYDAHRCCAALSELGIAPASLQTSTARSRSRIALRSTIAAKGSRI